MALASIRRQAVGNRRETRLLYAGFFASRPVVHFYRGGELYSKQLHRYLSLLERTAGCPHRRYPGLRGETRKCFYAAFREGGAAREQKKQNEQNKETNDQNKQIGKRRSKKAHKQNEQAKVSKLSKTSKQTIKKKRKKK